MAVSKMENKKCVVLISSCDAYSDIWEPFFNLFWKYWADCPFEVVLCSNFKKFNHPKVLTVCVGSDESWSGNVKKVIKKINADYVLFLLEDFFLNDYVDTSKILEMFSLVKSLNIEMLRIRTNPGPDIKSANSAVGIVLKQTPYRVSTQAAIWKKSCFFSLLDDRESIWQFEWEGSKRSGELFENGFYGTWQTILPYHHVLERGKWFRKDAYKYGKMNIGCDFTKRKIMSHKETVVWYYRNIFVRLFEFLFDKNRREKIISLYHKMR